MRVIEFGRIPRAVGLTVRQIAVIGKIALNTEIEALTVDKQIQVVFVILNVNVGSQLGRTVWPGRNIVLPDIETETVLYLFNRSVLGIRRLVCLGGIDIKDDVLRILDCQRPYRVAVVFFVRQILGCVLFPALCLTAAVGRAGFISAGSARRKR
ncbi:unknown [Candidatus Colimorpha enterica]|uniref:Uncharacterized protein n=1 Tax=Candidatus Colimorpha enterica TaxID=3083063 RepID=R6U5F9_9BACT|nr:unknown [Candidatus Colimorpha enterica]